MFGVHHSSEDGDHGGEGDVGDQGQGPAASGLQVVMSLKAWTAMSLNLHLRQVEGNEDDPKGSGEKRDW